MLKWRNANATWNVWNAIHTYILSGVQTQFMGHYYESVKSKIESWLVVWNLDFIFPYIGNNHPNWRTHIFSKGYIGIPSIRRCEKALFFSMTILGLYYPLRLFRLLCNGQVLKVFLLNRHPKWFTMKSRYFFHKRITAIWEHLGNFGRQNPSIQINCSNFWLSQFKDVRFCLLSAAELFFACANPLNCMGKKTKSIVLQMVLQVVFFCCYFISNKTIYSIFFCTRKTPFCMSSCSTHDMSCLFLRAPNRVFFSISSCLKSCYCNRAW